MVYKDSVRVKCINKFDDAEFFFCNLNVQSLVKDNTFTAKNGTYRIREVIWHKFPSNRSIEALLIVEYCGALDIYVSKKCKEYRDG